MSILPTKVSTKPKKIDPATIVLYGPGGVGKSTFGSKLSNALIIDTEKSTEFLSGVMAVDVQNSFKTFVEVIKELQAEWKTNGKITYDYIIVDSLDGLVNDIIYKEVCRRHNKNDISDFEWGAGYAQAKSMLIDYMNFFEKVAKCTIYMCHYKKVDSEEGEVPYSLQSLNFSAGIKTAIVHKVDVVGLFISEDGERKINFTGSDNMQGKSRAHHVTDKIIPADWDQIFIDK